MRDPEILVIVRIVSIAILSLTNVVVTWENELWLCSSSDAAEQFLCKLNKDMIKLTQAVSTRQWEFETNMTKENERKLQKALLLNEEIFKKKRHQMRKLNVNGLPDSEVRQFKLLRETTSPKNKTLLDRIIKLQTRIQSTYNSARVCLRNGTCLQEGEAGITEFFRRCDDPKQLGEAWKGWRDQTGRRLRDDWLESMGLRNIGANEHHFHDIGAAERFYDFEMHGLMRVVRRLFDEVAPLYRQIHGYVRYKLRDKFPTLIKPFDPIPAHLLGDPWAQKWSNRFPLLIPYPKSRKLDHTKEMRKKHWTILKMAHTADRLFRSLGFEKMMPKFWKFSEFIKPKHRHFDCHASAFDLSTGDDYRIKMCGDVDFDSLETIHHEMGHIVYYMSYRHQPPLLRNGANSGFHEAIGDTVALTVGTESYLNKIGLFKQKNISAKEKKEMDINTLMQMALKKVVFLPYALVMDAWRWGAYSGSIKSNEVNKVWWAFRRDIQGLAPPVERSEKDFDPGAKYHVANDMSYIRYFLSFIMQFQFYEAMCRAKGYPDNEPLHSCDFSGSKAAGKLLRSVLKLGSSKHWSIAMRKMTGQSAFRTDSLLRYFRPLQDWLTEYNCKQRVPIGWNGTDERSC